MLLNLRIKIRRRDVIRVEMSSMEAKRTHGEILINTLNNYDMDVMEKTISNYLYDRLLESNIEI